MLLSSLVYSLSLWVTVTEGWPVTSGNILQYLETSIPIKNIICSDLVAVMMGKNSGCATALFDMQSIITTQQACLIKSLVLFSKKPLHKSINNGKYLIKPVYKLLTLFILWRILFAPHAITFELKNMFIFSYNFIIHSDTTVSNERRACLKWSAYCQLSVSVADDKQTA